MEENRNMDAELNYRREILSFEEKIALAELEVVKGQTRVATLKYEKSRFMLDVFVQSLQEPSLKA